MKVVLFLPCESLRVCVIMASCGPGDTYCSDN